MGETLKLTLNQPYLAAHDKTANAFVSPAKAGHHRDVGTRYVHCPLPSPGPESGGDPVRVARHLGDTVEVVLNTYAKDWASKGEQQNLGDVPASAVVGA
jgi:hypothetical protein